jgi:DNA-binding transcriptional regulator YiaG
LPTKSEQKGKKTKSRLPARPAQSKLSEAIKTTFGRTRALPKGKKIAQLHHKRKNRGLEENLVLNVRTAFGLSRKAFARVTSFSERTISGWEGGSAMTEPGLRKMRELKRLHRSLAGVMKPEFVHQWLESPNEEFEGFKPLELIERGEIDRIFRFVYDLESGMPI